jgi:hypothetical protein
MECRAKSTARCKHADKLNAASRDVGEREAAALAAKKQQVEEAASRRQSQLDIIANELLAKQHEVSRL